MEFRESSQQVELTWSPPASLLEVESYTLSYSANINTVIGPALVGMDPTKQKEIEPDGRSTYALPQLARLLLKALHHTGGVSLNSEASELQPRGGGGDASVALGGGIGTATLGGGGGGGEGGGGGLATRGHVRLGRAVLHLLPST